MRNILFYITFCLHAVLLSNSENAVLTIEKVYPNYDMIEVSASKWISPGTIATFHLTSKGQISFVIYRSLSVSRNDLNPKYLARHYPTANGLPFEEMKSELKTTSQVQLSYDPYCDNDREYWKTLSNIYFPNKWLTWEDEPQLGEPLALNASFPNVEGYLCILEVREDRIIVRYPVKGELESKNCTNGIVPRRDKINLTYSTCPENTIVPGCDLPYVCDPFKPKKRNRTTIVAIVSTMPRPLSHFMPKKFGSLPYYDNQNLFKVDPSTIGPGFDIPKKQASINYRHPDLLPVDTWDIDMLEYYLRF